MDCGFRIADGGLKRRKPSRSQAIQEKNNDNNRPLSNLLPSANPSDDYQGHRREKML